MPTLQEQQRSQYIQNRLAYIKGECHNAVHPTVIRDRLTEIIELMEWAFFGRVSNEQPHVVPGVPVNQLEDPSRTRVTFSTDASFMGAQPQGLLPSQPPSLSPTPASQPVRSGDVQFMPGALGGGGAVGGQTVEFYAGPGQPSAAWQRVEFFGTPPSAEPAVSSPLSAGPAGSSPAGSSPPAAGLPIGGAMMWNHSQGPIPTFSNQPQQILRHTQPTLNTEAGSPVAPTVGAPTVGLAVGGLAVGGLLPAGSAVGGAPTVGALTPMMIPQQPPIMIPQQPPMMIPQQPPLNATPVVIPTEIPVNPPMNAGTPAAPVSVPQTIPAIPTSNPAYETTSFSPNFLIPGL